jgi:osmotically-inducible protein OsmY
MPVERPSKLLLVLLAASSLQGCVALVGTGIAAGAMTAYDRRTAAALVDDQYIEFKANETLAKDQELWDQSHINVTSYNGVILLTGETPSETLRTRTATLLQGIERARRIHNELAVAAPSSLLSRSSDTLITTTVKSSLLRLDVDLAGRTKVITENGVVYLMGLVTREEADASTNVARQTSGVQRVVRIYEYID